MSTLTDLDQINADLMGSRARNAFPRDIEPGHQLSGRIIAAVRRQRRDGSGKPLFWVNRKPSTAVNGEPVIDAILIIDTGESTTDDPGVRALYLDRDVADALFLTMRAAGAGSIQLGDRLDGFMYAGPAESGSGRVYDGGTYIPVQTVLAAA